MVRDSLIILMRIHITERLKASTLAVPTWQRTDAMIYGRHLCTDEVVDDKGMMMFDG